MTPLLLGLLVVGLLLPNLNKLKLPGGFEAEIRELKTKENISSGPKGDIGFGSSLVNSRIRVPLPAARMTAFILKTKRPPSDVW